MPFDGRTAALTIPNTLAAALTQSGIEPIDSRVLDAHKAEELRRHPAGWFYRHRVAVQIAILVLLIADCAIRAPSNVTAAAKPTTGCSEANARTPTKTAISRTRIAI